MRIRPQSIDFNFRTTNPRWFSLMCRLQRFISGFWKTKEVVVVTQVKHYINGKQVSGRNGRTSSVFNPATGEKTGLVPIANAADVADAVAAATRAAPGWAATTPLRRARILNRFLRILEDRIDELADVIVSEHGKVHSDAVGEIQRGMEVVEFATAAPQLLKGELTENVGTRVDRLLHATAPRRGRRHYPVQFPCDGADVDVSRRPRLWKRLYSEAIRTRSIGVSARRGVAQGSRPS
jgi:hypothetical protein